MKKPIPCSATFLRKLTRKYQNKSGKKIEQWFVKVTLLKRRLVRYVKATEERSSDWERETDKAEKCERKILIFNPLKLELFKVKTPTNLKVKNEIGLIEWRMITCVHPSFYVHVSTQIMTRTFYHIVLTVDFLPLLLFKKELKF